MRSRVSAQANMEAKLDHAVRVLGHHAQTDLNGTHLILDGGRKIKLIDKFGKVNDKGKAYYKILGHQPPESYPYEQPLIQDKWVKLAFDVDQSVEASVAENSINPQNIEADIRKKLLPRMFQECKAIGGGMDQAKKIVEMVVQITRVGLSGM